MSKLPIPSFFDTEKIDKVWRVPYQQRADDAEKWAKQHRILPSSRDRFKMLLMLVDVQNTFCIPDFELYVGGASGRAAVDDNSRLCGFIYRNLNLLTRICPTMDTHQTAQIFHSIFLINEQGEHPAPYTLITEDDIKAGVWRFNPDIADGLGIDPAYGQDYLRHYTRRLKQGGKYDLTVWPYHAMLGGIGHALVSSVEEAVFFHSIARLSRTGFQVKGNNPLTENYSVLRPEVLDGPGGEPVAKKNIQFIKRLMSYDAVVVAGQAKSHCVAWTIDDLLNETGGPGKGLAEKIYLLEDCTSPVVIPGVIDYTRHADKAFNRFADAGMHLVRSTDPIAGWPGIDL